MVMLRIMARRFRDMGEAYPKEYTDELEAAFLIGKHDFCSDDQCLVETSVQDNVFLNQCGICEFSFCKDHVDAHVCVSKKKTVETLTRQSWAAGWEEKPGSAFDLLDPLPFVQVATNQPCQLIKSTCRRQLVVQGRHQRRCRRERHRDHR